MSPKDDTAPEKDPTDRGRSEPVAGNSPVASGADSPLARRILGHLLRHHGQLIRFEAPQWTTEFGILRALPEEDPAEVKRVLQRLAELRLILPRSQYVVGYSDPKIVYVLTPAGRRRALANPTNGSDG